MRRSTDHILSSHGGNLPRPAALDALLVKADENRAEIDEKLPGAVQWVVDKQIECGVDIVNDGEYVKAANMGHYAGYIQARVTGFATVDRDPARPPKRGGPGERDRRDFPGYYESGLWYAGSGGPVRPGFSQPPMGGFAGLGGGGGKENACTGPITYVGQEAIGKDIDALKAALAGKPGADGFIAALGPLSTGAARTTSTTRPSATI
ncbi:MAG: hypothetical protein WDN24_12660 [Sphingomonas sp.]